MTPAVQGYPDLPRQQLPSPEAGIPRSRLVAALQMLRLARHGLEQLLAAHTQTRLSPLLPWELRADSSLATHLAPCDSHPRIQTPPKLREQKTPSPPTTSTSRMTQEESPMNNQAVCLASCASLMQGAGNLLQGSQVPTASEPKPQGSARLTWTKASNRGPLSHLRRANDLAQWATSPDVRPGTWGSRSAAKRWNTCVCWKPSLPSG